MDDLRFVRREDQSLIVATDSGEEFRVVVDETVLAELRHLSRRAPSDVPVRPREIQALIREGKSRAEVAEITGLPEDDVERFEEPVLAERRYILERAQAVPVRTRTGDSESEQFGAVIAERLIALHAEASEWRSWREPETGWMISLEFSSHGVDYSAIWGFEQRKSVLTPLSPDAVNLSKQGDVGDRLIPKLRAVEREAAEADEAEAGAPNVETADAEHASTEGGAPVSDDSNPVSRQAAFWAGASDRGQQTGPTTPVDSTGADQHTLDDEAEFARRREIEQRAISTTEDLTDDLGHTADLLDALRRRRGVREGERASEADRGRTSSPVADDVPVTGLKSVDSGTDLGESAAEPAPQPQGHPRAETAPSSVEPANEMTGRTRRRASIPSWDDILFGTRSDEDPAS